MKRYKFLEHTADEQFEAYGRNLNELFENSALALQEIQCNTEKIEPAEKIRVELESPSIEMLLFNFLQELLYYRDSKELLLCEFKVRVKENEEYKLEAEVKGDKIKPEKHELGSNVKAITLHNFKVEKEDDKWIAKVIVDV